MSSPMLSGVEWAGRDCGNEEREGRCIAMYYRGPISLAKRVRLASTLLKLASPVVPGWQKLLGHLKEAILSAQWPANAVLIRLPIPMDIRWRYQPCERRKDLNLVPAKLSFEEVAIAAHTRSRRRLLEGAEERANVATIPRLERRGKLRETWFLRRCMSTGNGTRYHQELVGLSGA